MSWMIQSIQPNSTLFLSIYVTIVNPIHKTGCYNDQYSWRCMILEVQDLDLFSIHSLDSGSW